MTRLEEDQPGRIQAPATRDGFVVPARDDTSTWAVQCGQNELRVMRIVR